ncbi:MAG: CoA transferase, partial [Acidimicrobiia bacterium]|nr:CoA transferase [Acidimicrobiia bacterium]
LMPMGCFESADGHVNVAGPSGRLWRSFCAAIGRPDLPDDDRFESGAKRHEHRSELNGIIADRMRTHTTAEWVDLLATAGVPAGPVYAMDEVFADPQIRHLAMVEAVEHPALGRLEMLRHPVRMTSDGGIDGLASTVRTPTPDPGDHTDEVLAGLGLSPAQIDDLRVRHIV